MYIGKKENEELIIYEGEEKAIHIFKDKSLTYFENWTIFYKDLQDYIIDKEKEGFNFQYIK